jgi:NADPH-dependent stearoyl-CoA 9-desaturase
VNKSMSVKTIKIGPKSAEDMAAFQKELDDIAHEALQQVGERDARYIRNVLRFVRITDVLGRALLMFGWFPPTWLLGSLLVGISRIVDNMEIGHNVMHGQYNFMNDPRFHGDTYRWNGAVPSCDWKHSHNYVHHTYTNVIGKDRDFGYGMLRLSSDLRWRWFYHPMQGLYMILLAVFFEWFVAMHDIQTDKLFTGRRTWADARPQWLVIRAKMWWTVRKEFIYWPATAALVALAFGVNPLDHALAFMAGNFASTIIRNLWAWAIIFCGHFTDDIYIFSRDSIKGETKGQWYLRQILGSSNISGGFVMRLLSGNLSFQIEHHLFPDMPSTRYKDVAPKVQAVCQKYGLPYNKGNFLHQLMTVFKRVGRYSLPGGSQSAMALEVDTMLADRA